MGPGGAHFTLGVFLRRWATCMRILVWLNENAKTPVTGLMGDQIWFGKCDVPIFPIPVLCARARAYTLVEYRSNENRGF